MLSLHAELEPRDAAESRLRADRRKLRLLVPGSLAAEGAVDVLIHDLSPTGILIESDADVPEGEEIDLMLPEAGATRASVVWSSGRFLGCAFKNPVPSAVVSAALLRAPIALSAPAIEPPVERTSDAFRVHHEPNPLPPAARFAIVVGTSLALWALTAWAAATIWRHAF